MKTIRRNYLVKGILENKEEIDISGRYKFNSLEHCSIKDMCPIIE